MCFTSSPIIGLPISADIHQPQTRVEVFTREATGGQMPYLRLPDQFFFFLFFFRENYPSPTSCHPSTGLISSLSESRGLSDGSCSTALSSPPTIRAPLTPVGGGRRQAMRLVLLLLLLLLLIPLSN